MRKLRVMTVVGTRPELIRLSRIIARLDAQCEHILVHTGQNYDYELNQIFFDELEIRAPDYFLGAAERTAAQTIGKVISEIDKVLDDVRPDALLILGDTNSCLSCISAKRRKVPIFHLEAGNRCYDYRVPEEINRRIVDHVSDINLTYSQIAREYLLAEGFPPEQIICVGSPMREVLKYYNERIGQSSVLADLGLEQGKFFLVSAHREENVDAVDRLRLLVDVLNSVAGRYGLPIVFGVHPRTRLRLEQLGNNGLHELVRCTKPFGFCDYVKLQMNARVVLSDSGTITEESSILNFPAINLRDVHERPEGAEEAAVMFTGLNKDRVERAMAVLATQSTGPQRTLNMVRDYEPENVSEKVLRILISYTDYVRQRVWQSPQ